MSDHFESKFEDLETKSWNGKANDSLKFQALMVTAVLEWTLEVVDLDCGFGGDSFFLVCPKVFA
jgi:hypothetical protein